MDLRLFDKWLKERQFNITLFIILFFFLDLLTTYIGTKLGGFEINPLARPAVQAGSWPALFFIKAIGTTLILYGFYYLYKRRETQKKEIKVIIGNLKYKTYVIDQKLADMEMFTWGLLLGISASIIAMNFATIVMLLG